MPFLDSFWEAFGSPFGTLLRPILGSGPVLEAFGGARWRHFGPIRSPLGFDVIFGPAQ